MGDSQFHLKGEMITQGVPVSVAPVRQYAVRAGRGPILQAACIVALLMVASVVTLMALPAKHAYLATPVLAMVLVAALFIAILWTRDGTLPVFEVGSLCVAATTLYAVFPFLGFLMGGLTFDELGDGRLPAYGFDVVEIALFAWRYAVYLACLAAGYLLIRGRPREAVPVDLSPARERRLLVAFVCLLLLQYSFRWGMYLGYGLDVVVPYSELGSVQAEIASIPYWLWQITDKVLASMLLVKLGLLLLLLRHWRSLPWRAMLIGWLTLEVIQVTIRLGGRTSVVLLLLSAGLLYHRLVKPLKVAAVSIGAALLLGGFLVFGFIRGFAGSGANVGGVQVFTASNEFQSLFATAYDVYQRKKVGTLGAVPWQIYVSDLYILIPSQLLPFYKWDPAEWYLEVIGARGTNQGFMFGVMSQAVLGFDWIELIIRGTVLGGLLAALHRWYVQRASRFWPTLFYLFVSIWSYYTIRATTFWGLHFIVYQFIPVMIAVWLIEVALFYRIPSAHVKAE